MSLISKLNPTEGFQDLWSEFRRPHPYKYRILAASMLITTGLFYFIVTEEVIGPPVPPEVTYITTFDPERTEADIIAANIENQKRKEQRAAILAEREERKKEIYRTLARVSGMDPEEIEREAAEERAREEAAAEQQRAAALGESAADGGDEPAE
ncbi:hypothetical protein [Pontixanthobacter aquaemixtae]|uniref:Uncharacterized protein n=1 Tax=Pontixanthobacter aquaemixtae TaxID=1958940 RepID=A0A844ZNJ1_9SPHN|nr:hypothetical protein [Pontixanthobacter aquaemixtae]MXO89328.1 hypothetical protein [Pontixanthobacter aquaemixtae]